MKKSIILPIVLLFFLSSCDDGLGLLDGNKRIVGKGSIEKFTHDAKDFSGIDLMLSANVIVKQASEYKVQIEGQKNVADLVETNVNNGILEVKLKKGSWNLQYDKLNIYVETPSVSNLKISGSGDMKVETALTSDNLTVDVSGSGNFSAPNNLNCKTMKIEIGGSGNVELGATMTNELSASVLGSGNIVVKGSGENAKLEVTGSGDINASDFKTKSTTAHTTGSGNINCFATEKIDAQITGSGDINYGGNPPSVQSKMTGSGSIKKL